MSNRIGISRRLLASLVLVAVPVGAMTTLTAAKQLESAAPCAIGVTQQAGMVRLDALVNADKHLGGTYTFHVEKIGGGGSSTINQGGDFDAPAGQTTKLSSVSLGSNGGRYEATLDVTIGGQHFSCTKDIGGV